MTLSFSVFASLRGPQSDDSVLARFEGVFVCSVSPPYIVTRESPPPTLGEIKAAYLYDFPEESAEEEMRSWRKTWVAVARARARCRRR